MRERWESETVSGAKWAAADFDKTDAYLLKIASGDRRLFEVIKGDIKETFRDFPDTRLSILRIDCDWYPETLLTLEMFWPKLEKGGLLILDDYGHHSGQKKAFNEFFDRPVKYTYVNYSCITIQK